MAQFYSDVLDEQLVYERQESFGGGMDAFSRATQLAADAGQYLQNILIPDNLGARTRPGASLLGATFTTRIQGAIYFDVPGIESLIIGSNAKLQAWNGAAWTELTGWTLNDAALDFSAAQGINSALFTDGTVLRSWNGATWDAAFTTGPSDPPTGATILLWHAGRMWAAGFSGSGGSGKEEDAICCSALLSFGNGQWSLTDQSFRVGAGEGDPVLGLISLPASVPEQAVLGVLKENSIHLVRTDPTATVARFQDTVVSESVAGGLGVVGKRAYTVLGNDLYFAAPDRSFRRLSRMQAAAAQYEVSDALSLPMQPYMDRINWTYASKIAVTHYRQLVFFSVPLDSSTVPNTVMVWSGRLQKWMGIWTGWTPNCWVTTRFSGVQRLIHGDKDGNVRQWKDYADATADSTYLDDTTAIATKYWTRAFLFGEPLNDKDPYYMEARFAQSNAVVNFTLCADNADVKLWSADMRPPTVTLPVTLPFDLINPLNTPTRKGLRGLQPCSECCVKIESAAGWFELRNLSLGAFLNSLATV